MILGLIVVPHSWITGPSTSSELLHCMQSTSGPSQCKSIVLLFAELLLKAIRVQADIAGRVAIGTCPTLDMISRVSVDVGITSRLILCYTQTAKRSVDR